MTGFKEQAIAGVSALVPTYDRPRLLRATLASLEKSYCDSNLDAFEVLVVDNKGDGNTERVVKDSEWSFPVKYMVCRKRGKNNALTAGIGAAVHTWLLFLDDDVVVEPQYLNAIAEGIKRWPDAAAMGGKVLPAWPECLDCEIAADVRSQVGAFAYGQFSPSHGSGLHPEGSALMEGNMMIRRKDLESAGGFDAACGPSEAMYRMGTHGDLFRKFAEMQRPVVYLEGAVVHHHIRPEQLTYRWLVGRAYSFGRSLGYLRYGARGIDGGAAIPTLVYHWNNRLARQFVFRFVHKEVPMRIAQIERHMIQGILYERIADFRRSLVSTFR